MDGTLLWTLVAAKRVKIFKKREEAEPYTDLEEADAAEEIGTNGMEGLEDNVSRIDLTIKLADATDDED